MINAVGRPKVVINGTAFVHGGLSPMIGQIGSGEGATLPVRSIKLERADAEREPGGGGTLEACITEGFAPKGDKVVAANLAAFRAGRGAVQAERV